MDSELKEKIEKLEKSGKEVSEALKTRIQELDKLQYCSEQQLIEMTALDKTELRTLLFEIYHIILSQHETIVNMNILLTSKDIDFDERIKQKQESLKREKHCGGGLYV